MNDELWSPDEPRLTVLMEPGRFHPVNRWEDAEYRLVFSRRFEDVCGNRLGEALDHLLAARQRSRSGALSFRPCLDGAVRAERGHHSIVVSYHCDRLANKRGPIVGAGPGISSRHADVIMENLL